MSSGAFRGPRALPDNADDIAGYWVRFGRRELPLEAGATLIGRGQDCRILVNEALVSRRHARIVVDGGRPYIEDLGSANGTFVNQAKLEGKALLFPGDRIFIGTCEIEIIRHTDEAPVVSNVPESGDRVTPPSGVGTFGPVSSGRAPAPRSNSSARVDTVRPVETPNELVEFEYQGRLADKMFTMGRIDAALKILSTELEALLSAARDERLPDSPLIDLAGRYAVKLAQETLDGQWVDAMIELHLLCVRPLREETVSQLAALRGKASLGSDALIAQYYEKLRSQAATMSPAERILCERVASLVEGLGTE